MAVVILFISPISKYLVEKYDEKYAGREITMDWAYVNPFTGYIHFKNFKIYEFKSDTLFFSANDISLNIAMLKLPFKTYEISELSLDDPKCIIIQNKKKFNFNDLIEKFSKKKNSSAIEEPVHFNILNVKINNGEFYFHEKTIPINYFIKNVNFESIGKRWDVDSIAAKISFLPGIGSGDLKGNVTVNFKNNEYHFDVLTHKLDLNIIGQYLKAMTNYGTFSANVDADLNVKGNLKDEENVTAKGVLAINDFHFGKDSKDDYASFEKLVLAINQVSPKDHKYFFDSVSLNHPYFKYERYDYLDNIQTMFGKNGSKITSARADKADFNLVIEIADYIKVLSKNFFQSNYKINKLAIYKGDLKFNDYSISEKFSVDLNPLFVNADSIDKTHQRVTAFLKSGIKPYGNVSVALNINPKNSTDFDMQYHFHKLSVPMFNPYIISYSSFPLDRGTMELNGKWEVKNGIIQSNNHLLLIDPRLTKRVKNKDINWLPMRLIMSFIRETGNVIDYEIPITGNLKDPKFHVKDVIVDVFENIFIKPVTTPYRMQVKNIETEIEKSLSLKWQMRNNSLLPNQEKFIERIADFLADNPGVSIAVYPQQYAIKEKEYILFYEAKKKYYLLTTGKNTKSFGNEDSIRVDKMSVKDSLFVHYLNKQIKDSLVFTIQEKCSRIIDSASINAKFKKLNSERVNAFMFYFKEKGVTKQIKIHTNVNVIPYNGFSFYKIDYKGEYPESLIKAYRKMNELNKEVPRDKFKMERRKNKNL